MAKPPPPAKNGPATSGPPTGSTSTVQNAAYDADGNLLSLHSPFLISNFAFQYSWDAQSRPLTATVPDAALGARTFHWDYDGIGRRVREHQTDPLGTVLSTKTWVWCGGNQPCEERDGENQVTQRFYAQGFQTLASPSSLPASFYYTKDHLGSIREVVDEGGNLRARYDYDAYGNRTKLSGDIEADFGFTGHLHHQGTGLILTHYRLYDPRLGRWLSRDPIAENGGINLYGYVNNDPINLIDPDGLIPNTTTPAQAAKNRAELANAAKNSAGAAGDFVDSYNDMREANWVNSDKYFHCMANCKAAQRGVGGVGTASAISEAREWFDENVKGDSKAECDADRQANNHGRKAGKDGKDCKSACAKYRPRNLPDQY